MTDDKEAMDQEHRALRELVAASLPLTGLLEEMREEGRETDDPDKRLVNRAVQEQHLRVFLAAVSVLPPAEVREAMIARSVPRSLIAQNLISSAEAEATRRNVAVMVDELLELIRRKEISLPDAASSS